MTEGQALALEQVERIASRSDAIEIVRIERPDEGSSALRVIVSVYCGDMERRPSGLPLRTRERLTLFIEDDFPYSHPSVFVDHKRFAGYPHVNWSRCLCLYQAPQTEWNPSAGMFGFLRRLEFWLRQAALDQLDATGGPLHPPVTYGATGPLVIPRRDAPVAEGEVWLGLVELREAANQRIDLIGWAKIGEAIHDGPVGAAILLDQPMPLEFPSKLGQLLECVERRGVAQSAVFRTLQAALLHNGKDRPLYVVLGTPMRGTRGAELRQHLTAWRVDTLTIDVLDLEGDVSRLISDAAPLGDGAAQDLEQLHNRVVDLFQRWSKEASVAWCRVREDRPEVTKRRDIGRPSGAFRGMSVELWGCGALGGYVAEWLVRAGVGSLLVRDNGWVTPGLLVRQPYADHDVGRHKALALADRLRAIYPECDIRAETGDALEGPLAEGRMTDGADLVIDATASNIVQTRVEEVWARHPDERCQLASIAIDRNAQRLLAVVVRPNHSGCALDVVRRMKLHACRTGVASFLDAFFPDPPPEPFQPEPGCSDATFVGSAADSSMLAASATNYIGETLNQQALASAAGCYRSFADDERAPVSETFVPDVVLSDPQSNYEVRMEQSVLRALRSWNAESRRKRGEDVETGGLLFGEIDEFLRIIWVSEASGPPADSVHAADEFTCGIAGTAALNAEKTKRTRRSVQYVGTWHTHPVSAAIPSAKDFNAMSVLVTESPTPIERLLLLILGNPDGQPEITASVFSRHEFEELRQRGYALRQIARHQIETEDLAIRPRIGIALSGGGSRAMAFHLGCLRALNDLGILNQADVLSTVSGGSVIGAMFAYGNGTFEDFEAQVTLALQSGFVGGIARRTLLSPRLLQIVGTNLIAGTAAGVCVAGRLLLGTCESLMRSGSKARGLRTQGIQPPFRRWVSRTEAFEQTLRDRLFADGKLTAARRNNIGVVINACELRTGTAFRFGSRESGSWRYGTVHGNDVDIATAVAASAAFPALLPAIDRCFEFTNRAGERTRERVILTDGGVYENLGVTCMTPEKDEAFSTNVYCPPYIICCDAGPGQFGDMALPYGWMTRMKRSFEATHRQVQHGLQKQLHFWRQHGNLRGFVYSYLGQQDERLPFIPPELVRRQEVVHYPTDFSPMTQSDIDLLSRRGEQLTRLLVEHYCPEL